MERQSQFVFLLLVLAQAAHSVEEYFSRLYEVFGPARFVSSLVSAELSLGFLVVNSGLVAFGVWCWAVPVRSRWPSAGAVAWFWGLLELVNGIGHSLLAASRWGYFPGVLTAPVLLVVAGWLVLLLARPARPGGQRANPR